MDAGDPLPDLEAIRQATGLSGDDLWAAVTALKTASPPYLTVVLTAGWSKDSAGGHVEAVSERARRELGAWPSADLVVDKLVEALRDVADSESEPAKKGALRSAADALGGIARDVAVRVIADRIGRL